MNKALIISDKPLEFHFKKILNEVFQKCNISIDNYPQIPFFQRGYIKNSEEYQENIEEFKKKIFEINPDIILCFGEYSYRALSKENFNNNRGITTQVEIIQDNKSIHPYIIPTITYKTLMAFFSKKFELTRDILTFVRRVREGAPRDLRNPIVADTFLSITTFLHEILKKALYEKLYITFDVESTCAHITWFGLSLDKNTALAIPFCSGYRHKWSEEEEYEIWLLINKIFTHRNIQSIAHNASYDIGILLMNYGIQVTNLYLDTMVAWILVFGEVKNILEDKKDPSYKQQQETSKSLGYVASILLDYPRWKHTAEEDKGLYNAYDVINTHQIGLLLIEKIKVSNLMEITEFVHKQLEPALFLQLRGILIDKSKVRELNIYYKEKIKGIKKELEIYGEINWASPKQLGVYLYEVLKFPVQTNYRKATGKSTTTTDKEALKRLKVKTQHPIFSLLLDLSTYTKLSTAFLQVNTSPSGRVHASYNIVGTAYGRWSSSKSILLEYGNGKNNKLNIQQIPKEARKLYVPEKGFVIIECDLIQAEAVVSSYLARDEQFMKLFENNYRKLSLPLNTPKEEHSIYRKDVHKIMASQLQKAMGINVEPEDIEDNSPIRALGKMVRHASNYGITANVLALRAGITLKEAKAVLEAVHKVCPITAWHKRIAFEVRKNRCLWNPFKRRAIFRDRLIDAYGKFTCKTAYSFVPQSTVGDYANQGVCNFYYKYGSEYNLFTQLHDAVYVECKDDLQSIKECLLNLREAFTFDIKIDGNIVPLDVDFHVGYNWGNMKGITIEELRDNKGTFSSYEESRNEKK